MAESIQIMQVTPELARSWLKGNTHNRPLHRIQVLNLRGRFERGEWRLSNDAITIAADGTIVNGQHRLTMISELPNGAAVSLLVMTGTDLALQQIIDIGRKRSFGNLLSLKGETNATLLAAATAWVGLYDSGTMQQRTAPRGRADSFEQLFAVLEWHPGLRPAVAWASHVNRVDRFLMGPISVLAAMYDLLQRADLDKGHAFMEACVGEGIERIPMTELLRKRLSAARLIGNQRNQVTIPPTTTFNFYVKAWNGYYNDRNLTRLQMGSDETTPKIAGYEPPLKETPNAKS